MNDVPGRLSGSDPLVRWLNSLRDAVAARTPVRTVNSELSRTVNGFSYRPGISPSSTVDDHPFKINRVSDSQFSITPGYIECPIIWASELFPKPYQPTFYQATSRIYMESTENTLSILNTANLTPTPDLVNFEVTFTDFLREVYVWYELVQAQGSPGDIMRVLRVEAGGEGVYHAGGLSGFASEFKLIVPIGTVSPGEIIQYALGHQPNRFNTGQFRWCGGYDDDRLYFPGDVVRKDISSNPSDPADWQTFLNRGDVDSGWDKQLCSIGIAPQDGTLGYDTWQRLTPLD